MTKNKLFKNPYFLLLLIILLGISLRLINLGNEPYWGDEVLSLDIVNNYQDDIPGMITYIKTIEIHPPLYYLMLHFWSNIFGFNEFGIRLLSLIFGIGVIILTYLLTKKLFNNKIGLLAAFFVAVLPMQIEFSQEARPYIIYTFFALLAAMAYWQYRENQRKSMLVLYSVSTIIGIYLHYSYILFALALAAYWLFEAISTKDKTKRSKAIITWLTAHLLITLVYYLQFIILLYKIALGRFPILDIPRSINKMRGVSYLESVFNQIIWTSKNQTVFKIEVLTVFLFKISFLTALIALLIKKSQKIKIIFSNKALLYSLWLMIAPIIMFFLFPQGVDYTPIFERHVITSSIFVAIILSYFLFQLDFKPRLLIAALFLFSIFNFTIIIVNNDSVWDPFHRWGIIADHIAGHYQEGDLVLTNHGFSRSDLNHFLPDNIEVHALYPINLIDYKYDFLASRKMLGLIENESQLRSAALIIPTDEQIERKMNYLIDEYKPKRIWLIFYEGPYFQDWFLKNNWKVAMSPLGPLFPVKLYIQR